MDNWIVAIGASGAEGIDDIKALLSALGPDLPAIVMVVLHRQFDRETRLREVLSARAGMPIVIAGDCERLELGNCYIGEPAAHLTLVAASLGDLVEDPQKAHRNRQVDLLFRSIAKHAGGRGIGVVLSGALDDGSRGIEAIHNAGGKTMVLRREQPQHGMPENAIAYDGPIDCIGSTTQIAGAIRTLTG